MCESSRAKPSIRAVVAFACAFPLVIVSAPLPPQSAEEKAELRKAQKAGMCGTTITELNRNEVPQRVPDPLRSSIPGDAPSCPQGQTSPPIQGPPAPSGLVSAQQLANPLTSEDKKLLDRIQSNFREGKRDQALEDLAVAQRRPSTEPYAAGILGAQYLREGNVERAIPELEKAARMLPGSSEIHANLGYALLVARRYARAESEEQQALTLNPNSSRASYLMGLVLLNENVRLEEAVHDLQAAEEDVPAARLALANYYAKTGDQKAAEQEREQYNRATRPK
jgi:tetratricopeptide (TPR) repeat protein